ncbi:hypothetical protein [Pseudonocardia acaciae]|uniref:hypothetical protein n=1 Tax=Pseudonocardia acaciae TaxID=551276 RepID=UPI00048BD0C7|nr:hypothetical protein [Pseudonocardia acaciae]
MTANAYAFLPYLRTGLSTRITADPTGQGTTRATIPIKLLLTGDPLTGPTPITQDVTQPLQLYGPGDVIGVDPRAISRTEPRPWTTNVEPNYLAHIEFYEEDFAWRYSPSAPDTARNRLRPWLALIVLEGAVEPGPGGEFTEGTLPGRPLPSITVTNPAALQPSDQLGAFAHVHVDGGLGGDVLADDPAEMAGPLASLRELLRTNPDRACSRIVCPRHLSANTGYHAFLVPAFETGRLAGLGLKPPTNLPGPLQLAWPPYQDQPLPGTMPYYHRWYFSTGTSGDFEYLVRLLRPWDAGDEPKLARRDIDVARSAGVGLPPIDTPAGIGGVLKLGGALQVTLRARDQWDNWDSRYPEPAPTGTYPHPFQTALAGVVNLSDDYLEHAPADAHAALANNAGPSVTTAAGQGDPVITPPLYGRWHARTARLLTGQNQKNWVHRLNLDPRFRVAANFGTQVVQARQEEFMAAAWEQVGDVLTANARIRAAQLAREVGHALQNKHVGPTDPAAFMAALTTGLTAGAGTPARPVGRILALTAPAQSRVTRPGQPTASTASTTDRRAAPQATVAVGHQVSTSQIGTAPTSPAMRRITRPGSRLVRTLPFPDTQPPEALLPRMDLPTGAVTAAPAKVKPFALVTPADVDHVLYPRGLPPLPTSNDFTISLPTEHVVPTTGVPDSDEATAFKTGLAEVTLAFADAAIGGRVTRPPTPLGVTPAAGAMLTGLSADGTVPRSLLSSVTLPERLAPFAERFIEAMAYPIIDLPMYQALRDLSVDAFVPNLNLVPPNSITLLETDQEFIEAYLVGLNHEMARELLWREYPTDQRCTPFRQFWDPRPALSPPGESPGQRRERLYDIKPITDWAVTSELGTHDSRETAGSQKNELVLVIRGELLKKYPNAAIYAHRARWQPSNANPDRKRERTPVEPADPMRPTEDEIKLPIYEAKVDPDITLLGFDLRADVAKGSPLGDPGWFFVIKERPGDPRFGLDDGPSTTRVEVWNDLCWSHVDPGGRTGFITLDDAVSVDLQGLDDIVEDDEKDEQFREDVAIQTWKAGLSSSDIAYILFQAPVLMAVHAQEMLP